jgi:muramoyltetrapeptide carboxypeptidase
MTARPPRLRTGDTIGVVAPAGPIKPKSRDQLQRGLDRLSMFRLRVAPSVTHEHPADVPSYLAASDDQRADELVAMLRDPDVRAIVLARGGFGIQRILPRLDPDDLRRDPKSIVGFSDATALLAWAHAAGVRGIHGPMVVQLGDLPATDADRLVTLLTDPAAPGVRPWTLATHGSGVHRGPLVIANLSMASLTLATPWPLPLTRAIAMFEEVGEKPYEIDRYLTHLMLAGALREVAAVVVGDFTRCEDPKPPSGVADPPDAALRVVRERLAVAGIACAIGAPIGHGDRNEAVPFGAACELDLDRKELAILEGAVQ